MSWPFSSLADSRLPKYIALSSVLIWIAVIVVLAFVRYSVFAYEALDLSIYTQVLWNTLRGDWFVYTFNNYSYLADHREWILLLIVPVFGLWQHPLMLICIQTVVLASSAYPLFRIITQHIFKENPYREWIGCAATIVLLWHPAIQSMALYEFHALTFVVPIIFFFWLAVLQQNVKSMWMFVVLALLVREDVGLMLCGAGVLMVISFRGAMRRHGIALVAISAVWTVLMIRLGGYFFPSGSAKFLIFYPQLGSSISEVFATIISHPFQAFAPLLHYDHLWVIVLLCSSVGLACLIAPVILLPAVLPLMLFLLIPKPMLSSIFGTHYSAMMIPWFVLASCYGARRIYALGSERVRIAVSTMVVVCIAVHMLLLSGVVYTFADISFARAEIEAEATWEALSHIGVDDSILVSHGFAPQLATRAHMYPALQVFRGKEHYAETPYTLPGSVDWVILRPRDMVEMTLNFATEQRSGWAGFAQAIKQNDLHLFAHTPDVMIWGKTKKMSTQESARAREAQLFSDVEVQGITLRSCVPITQALFEFEKLGHGMSCTFVRTEPDTFEGDVHMLLTWRDDENNSTTQWVNLITQDVLSSHSWSVGAEYVVTFPVRSIIASQTTLSLVGVSVQPEKIFFGRTELDISPFPHSTVDVTLLFEYAVSEK